MERVSSQTWRAEDPTNLDVADETEKTGPRHEEPTEISENAGIDNDVDNQPENGFDTANLHRPTIERTRRMLDLTFDNVNRDVLMISVTAECDLETSL